MTQSTPGFDIAAVVPLKYKPFVALIGAGLTFIIPTVLQYSTALPAPWPAVIAGVVALLTFAGVYRAPYQPAGTSLVPDNVAVVGTVLTGSTATKQVTEVSGPLPALPTPGAFGSSSPWKPDER